MPTPNPLHEIHQQAQAELIPYGPGIDADVGQSVQIVETFGQYEAEYAAIRKGVGLMDMPQFGLVRVIGSDRLEFLHRMLTNDTNGLEPGQCRRAFLLSKAGRVAADITILHGSEHTDLVLEVFQADGLTTELDKYLFSEDVQLKDVSDQYLHLALHGPASAAMLTQICGDNVCELGLMCHQSIRVAGYGCTVYRCDDTGSSGLHLIVPRDSAAAVYQHFLDAFQSGDSQADGWGAGRGRPIGWLAYNTARIEAGTPLYHIDFGPDSLPHETGILDQTVSFTKGCYLGQEIVARMQSLGHPKQVLVGLKLEDDRLPIAGSQVLEPQADGNDQAASDPKGTAQPPPIGSGAVVGAITSSTVSPMLGGQAIVFAMVKWAVHKAGTMVLVPAEGQLVRARVQGLSFYKP